MGWSAWARMLGALMASQRRMAWSWVRVSPSTALPTCMPRACMPIVARILVQV